VFLVIEKPQKTAGKVSQKLSLLYFCSVRPHIEPKGGPRPLPSRTACPAPEETQARFEALLRSFSSALKEGRLREQVLALVESFRVLRKLGSSLIPREDAPSARARILVYFRAYPLTVLHGDELMVVSGIQDWPRRVRELTSPWTCPRPSSRESGRTSPTPA
jgi:hypothetical protein